MFELRGVTRRFGAVVALERLDLEFETGRTTALIGPSGCGKSTLLRLLLALDAPDEGEVRFDGVPLGDQDPVGLRQRIGYVPQEGGLFPHLTARDNVTLVARHLGWDPQRCGARVAELGDLVALGSSLLGRYPSELSGGQRQRVALMRGLMLDPAALLLDEPLGALDPMIRFELQEDLAEICARLGKTVVLVTHDLSEAAFLGDHVVLLEGGRIRQQGSIAELLERPADAFVERFVRAQRPNLGRDSAAGQAAPESEGRDR